MKSALHYACEEGKTNAVAALLESGPDIDLQDNEGHTPLHKAAVRGHLAVVKLLRMVFNFSRCHFIVDTLYLKIIIRQYHAYINIMVYDDNFDHITPLDCAILSGLI